MSILLEKQQVFARVLVRFLMELTARGYRVTLGEALRTAEQAEIYAKQGKGIKNSKHCKKLALDLNLFKDGKLLVGKDACREAGILWEKMGGIWGGNFKKYDDYCHFEWPE
jgi:hypothetical protein